VSKYNCWGERELIEGLVITTSKLKGVLNNVLTSTDETKSNYMTDGQCVDYMVASIKNILKEVGE